MRYLAAFVVAFVLSLSCTAPQRRAVLRFERDCRKIESDPVTPSAQRYACENADAAIDLVIVGATLLHPSGYYPAGGVVPLADAGHE